MLMMDCKCNTGGFRGRIPPPFFSLTVLEIFNEKKTENVLWSTDALSWPH